MCSDISKDAAFLNEFQNWAGKRNYAEITCPEGNTKLYLGWRMVAYMNSNLTRCTSMMDGVATAIQTKNRLLGCLALRAQIECLGGIAYLWDKCRNLSVSEHSSELIETLNKLSLGGRKREDAYQAINVMTQIEKIDKIVNDETKEFLSIKAGIFKWLYESLCELCHPNLLGLLFGTRATINLKTDKEILSHFDYAGLLSWLAMSCMVYRYFFDKIMNMLKKQKMMPEVIVFDP